MESTHPTNNNAIYPLLVIPKMYTTLEFDCDLSNNIFIELTITCPDNEGNEVSLYSGFCNIRLIDSCDDVPPQDESLLCNKDQNSISDTRATYPSYTQSYVWIDPAKSPYVYNNFEITEPQEQYSESQQPASSHVTVEQHNTYITQNIFNGKDSICYSPLHEFEHEKLGKVQHDSNNENNLSDQILFKDDDLHFGIYLPQLPEEIWNGNESQGSEERTYVETQTENNALKQLMSSDIKSLSKQQKTILFLGQDSLRGETIQKIAINDPYLKCAPPSQTSVNEEVVKRRTKSTRSNQKKYQCDKCKQIFDQLGAFKQHMISNQRNPKLRAAAGNNEVNFMCLQCGKKLKNQEKFEMHCLGHGDPEVECDTCHKVFASKFTLRTHKKIHLRKHPCGHCSRTYSNFEDLKKHAAKFHLVFMCDQCPFTADCFSVLNEHENTHSNLIEQLTDKEFDESMEDDLLNNNTDSGILSMVAENSEEGIIEHDDIGLEKQDEIAIADSIIAQVVSSNIFMMNSKKSKRDRKMKNTCNVCSKTFDRVSDLKRHLIEHVIRSTLAKIPVNNHGALNIRCEICQLEVFTKVDKYKAHLREHAKLTLYKCTFCDKSFSDSSNFSKHKKIHGSTFFQCDLCQRKFNSKKMLTQHIEYHNNNSPIPCCFCDKLFYFKSMLNKHIKCAHTTEVVSKFRCKFCNVYVKSLKDKWDHEWTVHNLRKIIVDCTMCDAKYRKYSELKRHCSKVHDLDIPAAKHFKKTKC